MKKLAAGRLWLKGGVCSAVLVGGGALAAPPPGVVISTPAEALAFGDAEPFVFEGQSLAVHSSFATDRALELQRLAPVIVGADTQFTLNGVVSSATVPMAAPLEKRGPGTLALRGANTYTSNTVLREGVLRLGGAAALGDSLYNLEQHAGTVLQLEDGARLMNYVQVSPARAGDLPLAGLEGEAQWQVESGSALLGNTINAAVPIRKTGAGTLRLTGVLQGGPELFVAAGALAVDGVAAARVDVADGARLEGLGELAQARIRAGGIVAPGGRDAVGVLGIWGDAVFDADSLYHVNAHADGQADLLRVGGTAELDGAVWAEASAGTWSPENRYLILEAAGGLGDTRFDSVSANLAFLNPELEYDTDKVYLALRRNDLGPGDVAETPDEKEVGDAIDPPEQPVPPVQPEPEPVPESKPEPAPDPVPDPEPEAEPKPEPAPKPKPTPKPKPAPKPKPKPEPKPATDSTPTEPEPSEPDLPKPPPSDPKPQKPKPEQPREQRPAEPNPDLTPQPEPEPEPEPGNSAPVEPEPLETEPELPVTEDAADETQDAPAPEPPGVDEPVVAPPLTPLQEALQGMSVAQVRTVLRHSTGSWHASVRSFLMDDGRYVRRAVLASGADAWGSSWADAESGRGHLSRVVPENGLSRVLDSGLRTWAQVYAATGRRHAVGDVEGDRHDSRGVVLGLDAAAGRHWRPGLVLAAQHAQLERSGHQASATLDSLYAGLSAHGRWDGMRVTVALLRAWHRMDSRRRVSAGRLQESLRSTYAGRSWQAVMELAPLLRSLPYLRHEWTRLRLPSHEESGGVTAHGVDASTSSLHVTTLGWRARHEWEWQGRPAWLEADLGWRHTWGDTRVASTQHFVGEVAAGQARRPFTSSGQPLRRNAVAAGLSASVMPWRDARLSLRYTGLLNRDSRDHAAWVDLRWAF